MKGKKEDMKDNILTIKLFFTACCTAFVSFFGVLAIPIFTMVLSSLIDYMTGLAAVPFRDEKISSYKSTRGIAKKLAMWSLGLVGWLFDLIVASCLAGFGITYELNIVACCVICWIAFTEMISIIENVKDMGVNIPSWLLPLIKNVQSQVDNKVETTYGAKDK